MDTLSASTSLSFSSHPMDPPTTTTTTTTTTTSPLSSPASKQQQQQQQQPKRKSSISEDKSHAKQRKEMHEVSATQCANCGTTTTPLWRRAPNGDTICNACGLYFKARNQFRPPTLKRNTHQRPKEMDKGSSLATMNTLHDCGSGPESGTCPGGGQCNGSGGSESCAGCPAFNQHQVNRQALICANCRTTTTPLWRRDESGNTICNACGLYYKLHGMHRPVSMKRSVIKRRKRVVVAETSSSASASPPEEKLDDEGSTEDKHQHHRQVVVRKQPKNKSPTKSSNSNSNNPSSSSPPTFKHDEVPPIEDYIVPKRQSPGTSTTTTTPFMTTTTTTTTSSSSVSSPPPPLVAPRPRLPQPSNGIESLLLAAEVDVGTTTSHNNSNNNNTTLLPPISLPPLTSSSSLSDFDDALDRLVRLRRQPSSQHTLQQIAPQLHDLVRRAEASCFQHPHQQQQQQASTPL